MTDAKIKQWKSRWGDGNIHEVTVPIDEEGNLAKCYVRKPDLATLSASAKFAETDPMRAGMILFENCWLEGDEIIKELDEAKLSVIKVLGGLMKVYEATIKKL